YHMKNLAVRVSSRPGRPTRGCSGRLRERFPPQNGAGARGCDRQGHSLQKSAPAGLSDGAIHFLIRIFCSHIDISLVSLAALHFFVSLSLMNFTMLSRSSFGI